MKPAWRRRSSAFTTSGVVGISGFTVIELLVVTIVIIAFVYLLLPRVPRNRPNEPVHCLNNLKQMMLGWVMYSSDSGDRLITNLPYASSAPVPTNNWIAGVMDWTANPQNTNSDLLLVGVMGLYLKSPGVYRCPSDRSESPAGPRIRSYAMNGFMGNGGSESTFTGWKQCLKTPDIRQPMTTFVFTDEHANSIDDGFFINNPDQTNAWTDLPASNHGKGAAGFGFADGHAEIHKWVDSSTLQPMKKFGSKPNVQLTSRGADLAWLLSATASRDDRSTNEPSR